MSENYAANIKLFQDMMKEHPDWKIGYVDYELSRKDVIQSTYDRGLNTGSTFILARISPRYLLVGVNANDYEEVYPDPPAQTKHGFYRGRGYPPGFRQENDIMAITRDFVRGGGY